MNRKVGALAMLAILGTLDALALRRFVPSPRELSRGIAAPHAWVSQAGPDAAVGTLAGALLWLAALWLMAGLLVTLAAALAGQRRGMLAGISRCIAPAVVRRLVIAATGATLVLGPVAANAAPATGSAGVATAPATGTPGAPSIPSPAPTLPELTTPVPPLDPQPSGTVLVRPGDSLWRITADRLGPSATEDQIAIGWPYWYRANRRLIGPDANLLRPGERLTAPTGEKGS